MANTFTFVQGDRRPFFAVIVKNQLDNAVVDLTGASGVFYMRSKYLVGQTAGSPKVNGVAVNITSAVNGQAEYRWAAGDTDVPGFYQAAFKFTLSDGLVQTVVINDVEILPKLG